MPWLEPDILDHLRELHARGVEDVVVAPLGFLSDHLEVLYDLDVEAAELAAELGLGFVRADDAPGRTRAFVADDPRADRRSGSIRRRRAGRSAACRPNPDVCAPDCCRPGTGRPSPWEEAVAAA